MLRNIDTGFDLNDQNCICLRINQKGGWCGKIVNTIIFLAIIFVGISAWKFSLLENTGISLTTFVGVLSLIGFIICRQVCISFIILNFGGCTIHGLCQNTEGAYVKPVYAIEMQEDCQQNQDCQRYEEVYRHDNIATQRFEEVDIKEQRFEEHIENRKSSDQQICILPNGKEVKAVIHEQENVLDQDKAAWFGHVRDKRNPQKSVSLKERRRLVLEGLLLPNKQKREQDYSYEFLEPVERKEIEYAEHPVNVKERRTTAKEATLKSLKGLLFTKKQRKAQEYSYEVLEPFETSNDNEYADPRPIFVMEDQNQSKESVNIRERRTAAKEATVIKNADERSLDAMVVVEEVQDEYQDPVNVKERRTASKEATVTQNASSNYYGNTKVVIEEMSDNIQDSVNIKERKTSSKEAMMLKSYDAETSNKFYESDLKVTSSGVLPLEDCREAIAFETEQEEEISLCSRILRFIIRTCMILVEILPALMLVALAVYFDINFTGLFRVKVICLCLLSFNLFLAITRNRSPTHVGKNQEKVTVKLHAVVTKD